MTVNETVIIIIEYALKKINISEICMATAYKPTNETPRKRK